MTSRSHLIFCATGKSGLGHLRRVTNIAVAVNALAPDIELALVTNAPVDGLAAAELALFSRIMISDREDMAATIAQLEPGPVVVDTAAIPDLGLLPVPLYLILRETIAERLGAFRLSAGRRWEKVFIPAPTSEWTLEPEAIGAREIHNVGWIYRTAPSPRLGERLLPRPAGTPCVLVATGGGGTDATARSLHAQIDQVIARLRAEFPAVHVLQVVGPRTPRSGLLAGADAAADVGSRLDEAFREADVVISTAGYNSILELAATDRPALLMGIARTYDDQERRATQWGPVLGQAHVRDQIDASSSWIAAQLRTGSSRRPVDLGPCGSAEVARHLVAAAQDADRAESGGLFIKTYAAGSPKARLAAVRARSLFRAGARTPPAVHLESPSQIVMPRLEGPTLRDLLIRQREVCGPASLSPYVMYAPAIVDALVPLHQAPPENLEVLPLDPWRMVLPRLARNSAAHAGLGERRMRSVLEIADRLMLSHRPDCHAASTVVVHGDLHCGQLIAPRGSDTFCIIDLDDLAWGAPESDLANFAAHIATTPSLAVGGVQSCLTSIGGVMSAAYEQRSGIGIESSTLQDCAVVALLRRLLKRAERGIDDPLQDEILQAARRLSIQDLGQMRSRDRSYSAAHPTKHYSEGQL